MNNNTYNKREPWTDEEINLLKSNLHLTNQELVTLLPGRTINNIKYKCRVLGLLKRTKFCSFNYSEVLRFKKDQEFNDRIIGHLLGDGTLNSDISFTLRNTNKSYVLNLQRFFNSLTGRQNHVSMIPAHTTTICEKIVRCKESYSFTFTCAPIVRSLKKKWYKNGKKIVPRDLKLNPTICNYWYCDDGSLYIDQANGNARIILYTDGFSVYDVNFLISLLSEFIEIFPRRKPRKERKPIQYSIVIQGDDILKFLNYIGPCPTESFAYKWDLKKYTNFSVSCVVCKQQFIYSGFVSYRKKCNKCKWQEKITRR